jgi:predicted ATP-dependent serine protease
MYYQGRVRPVYYQGKRQENPCQTCANNQYHAYGDERQCTTCKDYEFFKESTPIDIMRVKIFNWLNRKGLHARPQKDWPFVEIDWKSMGFKSRP